MQTPETSTDMEEAPEMRTPEDVAREIVCVRDYPDDDNGGMCRTHLTSGWPCNHRDVEILADLIRARDAEVAEAARAENARLREGIESVRVNALCAEEFLPRGSLALRETARKCAALLNPPTEGEK